MKKLLIASAVSALFAAPATVLAQAKPAPAPTLDKVLEASGISVSGYIDAGYTHLDKNAGFNTRVFDGQSSSFGLNQFGLTVAKQPKEGFGGLVNLTVGRDAQFIHSFPDAAPGSMFDITQAYLQYAGGPLTVIAGTILFGAIPFTHTGVRATWALSDTVSLIAGVNNGWDQVTDTNKGKTVELGATLNPIKPLNIALSAYSGKENTAPSTAPLTGADGTRTSINAVVSYAIIDPLSVGLEVLSVSQDNAVSGVSGSAIKGKYTGVAGYVTYMVTPKFRGVLRVESFDDKDGIRFIGNGPTATTSSTKYREATVTGAYLASDSFEARAEVRRDQGTNAVFTDSQGATSKSQMSIAFQGLYKF